MQLYISKKFNSLFFLPEIINFNNKEIKLLDLKNEKFWIWKFRKLKKIFEILIFVKLVNPILMRLLLLTLVDVINKTAFLSLENISYITPIRKLIKLDLAYKSQIPETPNSNLYQHIVNSRLDKMWILKLKKAEMVLLENLLPKLDPKQLKQNKKEKIKLLNYWL